MPIGTVRLELGISQPANAPKQALEYPPACMAAIKEMQRQRG
jgi:hypothetical protein